MSCDKLFLQNIDKIDLPYNKSNLSRGDIETKINIKGKYLNKIPKELLENDKYFYDRVYCLYKTIPELEGSNVDGLIDHIKILVGRIDEIKSNDKLLLETQYNFLLKNDCNLSISEAFPCDKISRDDIHAEFDNIHLQYINKEPHFPDECENNFIKCSDEDCKK